MKNFNFDEIVQLEKSSEKQLASVTSSSTRV